MYHLRQSTTAIIVANQMQQWVLCSLLRYTSLSKTEQFSVFENNTFMANICHREQKKSVLNSSCKLSDCNHIWIFSTDFHKSADRWTDGLMDIQTGRRTDRHGNANSLNS
jgi:hypothetical protein